ncbi:nickel-dependent hydrogenase large subunit [Corynebacterium aquilae]|uniref:Reducing hydrogenase subunit alpha n=1 Tax=Corynebacterium aquilae DSM 44791 TaxID=1431546 RepID=A0A1L7CDS5_9CORY|nr:nickel-dependent hydrogenase large subunit [Corynebacterium aquilae]APT84020.1 hypothetical protein CAQU_01850 [Corynebacterium aquilae DSM 44791]
MSETIFLDQFVDPGSAQVLLSTGADGTQEARFDLAAMPRLEPMLVGRDARDVPDLVKRLCGICPIPHHIAGVMALESAAGLRPSPLTVEVRRLLVWTSYITTFSPRFVLNHREEVLAARAIAKRAATWAGCPGHFPNVAAPGGLVNPIDRDPASLAELSAIAEEAGALQSRWQDTAQQLSADADVLGSAGDGRWAEMMLVNAEHTIDPLGDHVQVCPPDGTTQAFPVASWPDRVTESHPGAVAPRMVVHTDKGALAYKTGPQSRHTANNPRQAQAMSILAALQGIAASARAIATQLACDDQVDCSAQPLPDQQDFSGVGVGVVDSPRGLLAHVFVVDKGRLANCAIHTPTAQNEWWLSSLLTTALREHAGDMAAVEQAIRAADPCVPATDTPVGTMPISTVVSPISDARDE